MAEGETDNKEDYQEVYFSQIYSSLSISQTGNDIENPYGDNVHNMDENNISEYRADPTVEDGAIALGWSAINISSLQPLSKLSLTLASPPP